MPHLTLGNACWRRHNLGAQGARLLPSAKPQKGTLFLLLSPFFSIFFYSSSSTNLEQVAGSEQRALIWAFFFFFFLIGPNNLKKKKKEERAQPRMGFWPNNYFLKKKVQPRLWLKKKGPTIFDPTKIWKRKGSARIRAPCLLMCAKEEEEEEEEVTE